MAELLITTCAGVATETTIMLYALPLISIFFIILGLKTKTGFLGLFGAIFLLVTSWYLAPCIQFFSYVLALVGLVFAVYFVTVKHPIEVST